MQFSKLFAACTAILAVCGFSTVAHADFTSVTNTFKVNTPVGFTDPSANNTATDTDTANTIDLVVSKTASSTATLTPGSSDASEVTYKILLENRGLVPAQALEFEDTYIATGLTGDWTCTADGATCPAASGSGDISWTGLTIPADGTITIELTVTLASNFVGNVPTGDDAPDKCVAGSLYNSIELRKTAGTTTDVSDDSSNVLVAPYEHINVGNASALDDNEDSVCIAVEKKADLVGEKDDGLRYYTPGETSTYTLIAYNTGPSVATSVTMVDTLPAGITAVSTGTCQIQDSTGVTPVNTDITPTLPTIDEDNPTTATERNLIEFSALTLPPSTDQDYRVYCEVQVTWSTNMDDYPQPGG